MNFPFFIAKRTDDYTQAKHNFSRPTITIATLGVALSLIVMILSVSIITGFKNQITNKITGFGAHINITHVNNRMGAEPTPINLDSTQIQSLRNCPPIEHVQGYTHKPGIIQANNKLHGLIIKGVGTDFNWSFLQRHLIDGRIPLIDVQQENQEVLISNHTAQLLNLHTGDTFITYFFQDKVRVRKFIITGIYKTDFTDFDKMSIFTNQMLLQKLNGWSKEQVSGVEIYIHDFDQLESVTDSVYFSFIQQWMMETPDLIVQNIKETNPILFGWLDIIDMNVWIILSLMIIIACFNMTSGLLVIILERINMIGILKALGASNTCIRKIFLTQAAFIIIKGTFWGNLIACTCILIQKYSKILSLDPENYYIAYVPVHFSLFHLLLINTATILIILAVMILPSMAISRISPAKAIKFD